MYKAKFINDCICSLLTIIFGVLGIYYIMDDQKAGEFLVISMGTATFHFIFNCSLYIMDQYYEKQLMEMDD